MNSLQQVGQILPIAVLFQRVSQSRQLLGIDPALAECNLFGASHLQALSLLQCGDEAGRFQQAVVGARVQPSEPSAHTDTIRNLSINLNRPLNSNFFNRRQILIDHYLLIKLNLHFGTTSLAHF
jgi:hypothetical protein